MNQMPLTATYKDKTNLVIQSTVRNLKILISRLTLILRYFWLWGEINRDVPEAEMKDFFYFGNP